MENDRIRRNKDISLLTCMLIAPPVFCLGLVVERLIVNPKIETGLEPEVQLISPHTETFGAERQERKYVEVVVDGNPVKAYFEVDGKPAQDYFNNQK